eukprot:364869-Chlamydomonas_euryale.AAC.28
MATQGGGVWVYQHCDATSDFSCGQVRGSFHACVALRHAPCQMMLLTEKSKHGIWAFTHVRH